MGWYVFQSSQDWLFPAVFALVPFVIFFEVPLTLAIFIGILKHSLKKIISGDFRPGYFPLVSCMITCYSEGKDVQYTIRSLATQIYPGDIQIIAIVDGATKNSVTYKAAVEMKDFVNSRPRRSLIVVPKWQRGGRVSALNTGRNFAAGEIIMSLDGDTSFDNNMVERATRHFVDKNVAAVSGCLRVRNADKSLATRLQAIEYFISIQASKTGLSELGVVNNVSGAFGVFRASVIDSIKGWDSGTAEDLDITLRIKNFFGRYKKLKIIFDPESIGFTDVPETILGFFRQRLRWDGDLSYLYFSKHRQSFRPSMVGWKNFLMLLATGLFSQIVIPIMIVIYTAWIFVAYDFGTVFWLFFYLYIFYLAMLIIFWAVSVLLLSERPRADLKQFPYLFLVPVFAFIYRIHACFSTLWELIGAGSRDSSMAPWWVLRKSKF